MWYGSIVMQVKQPAVQGSYTFNDNPYHRKTLCKSSLIWKSKDSYFTYTNENRGYRKL